MSIDISKLEIVILHCPYMDFQNNETKEMFTKVVDLKFSGYRNKHKFGVLPVDTTDFIADHPLICKREEDGTLTPVCGSKAITYSTCKAFKTSFAMKRCLEETKSVSHLEYLSGILDNAEKNNKKIAYHGGYTIAPEYRKDKQFLEFIKELFIASTALYFKDQNIQELLGLGVPKYNTDAFFYSWGYERGQHKGRDLPSFNLDFLSGNEAILMHLKEFSNFTKAMADKHMFLWKKRTIIGRPLEELGEEKAAA